MAAAVAEEDAAFFEARADVSDVFAALADAAASPAFVVAVTADEAALFFDARAEVSLAFAASTLAFTSTASWFSAGISVLFRDVYKRQVLHSAFAATVVEADTHNVICASLGYSDSWARSIDDPLHCRTC